MKFPRPIVIISLVLIAALILTGVILVISSQYAHVSGITSSHYSEEEPLLIDEQHALKIVVNNSEYLALLQKDGNVTGVVISCPEHLLEQTGYRCLPAVSVVSGGNVTDFVIDPEKESVVRIVTDKQWNT